MSTDRGTSKKNNTFNLTVSEDAYEKPLHELSKTYN